MATGESLTQYRQPRSSRWLVLVLLIAPIVVMFAPVLFANRTFGFRDGAHFYHPLFQWIAAEWGQGRVPLWNPQENSGLPILADATSSIFYPGKLLFTLPIPFAYRYNLYVVGHVLLAAVGMYSLARRLSASQPTAVLAALAYACGGNVVFQYCNVVFLIGAAWLPAALLAIEEVVSNRCWRGMLFLAFVLAMMILGGDPQMAYHALLAAGLRLLCQWCCRTPSAAASTTASLPILREPTRWWLAPLQLAGAAVFAFLLAAVQILPSSEATKSSERAAFTRPRNIFEAAATIRASSPHDSLLKETPSEAIAAGIFGQPEKSSHQDRAYNFSVSPWRLIEFVWPNVSGRPFPISRNWIGQLPGSTSPWTPSLYLGLLPFLVGVFAIRCWKTDATTRWLSTLVLIFTLASFGWYGLGWVVREFYASVLKGDSSQLSIGSPVGGVYWLMVTLLPTYIYFRYPAKLMVVAVCALCGLGAVNADRLFAERNDRWTAGLRLFGQVSTLLAFIVWCASSYLIKLPMKPSQSFGPFDGHGASVDAITALLHAAVVAWLLQLILQKLWTVPSTEKQRWQWAIVGLTAVELVVANASMIFTAPAAMWSEPGPAAIAIRDDLAAQTAANENPGTVRPEPRIFRGGYQTWHAHSFAKTQSASRLQELVRWEHDTLFPKYHLASGLPLVESYGSLKLLDYESLLHVARGYSKLEFEGTRIPNPVALRMTACEYLLLPANAEVPFAERVTPDKQITLPENLSIWRMKKTQPRAWIVHHVVQLPPLTNTLDLPAVDARAAEVLTGMVDGKRKLRDFQRTAVVETDLPLSDVLLHTDPAAENSSTCEVLIDEPQHIQLKAKLARPGLLVLADSWSSGWQASLQSTAPQPLTIHRTNRCFRGIELPAGELTIDFHYRPTSFYRGGLISGISWLVLIGCCVFLGWRRQTC
ncbi:YfhO family protein [Anatilimnocola sp. NA78]|uniref:YfhO family protein n=1 Tax=Anatilimnocola sp. NA78 TaxID=3415683 RepID=UPI003CE4B57F